ncbi:MAG TPA: hypothetical protein VF188_15380 [Longimicrobiales bacterium]
MRYTSLLLVFGCLAACGRASDPRATANGSEADRPATSYDRQLVFVSDSARPPVAAVFHFTAAGGADSVPRTARAWLERDSAWTPVLGMTWTGAPMREPWRLVPHGSLRLVVGDGDELEALVYRAPDGFRLRPSPIIADWSPTATARFRLREAEFLLPGDRFAGMLLDIQTLTVEPDSGALNEAFLTDGNELHLVIATPEASAESSPAVRAWLRLRGGEETWDAVSLARDSARAAWRLTEPGRSLSGMFHTLGRELVLAPEPTAPQDSAAVRIHVVTGWVELRGERHDVIGVVRRGTR